MRLKLARTLSSRNRHKLAYEITTLFVSVSVSNSISTFVPVDLLY